MPKNARGTYSLLKSIVFKGFAKTEESEEVKEPVIKRMSGFAANEHAPSHQHLNLLLLRPYTTFTHAGEHTEHFGGAIGGTPAPLEFKPSLSFILSACHSFCLQIFGR